MKLIIGNTGLVGQTIKEHVNFDYEFNSKNIHEFNSISQNGDEIFLSCLPATKWMVNKNIEKDINNIYSIIEIISKKKYSNVILISTIDVYNSSPLKKDEKYFPNISTLNYGTNRYFFEILVKTFVKTENLKIFRLPALFSNKIKKNVLYDLINENNVKDININSTYQWYNLNNLHKDINFYLNEYPTEESFNLFTEPINTKEIIELFPKYKNFEFQIGKEVVYDYTTKFNSTGYLSSKKDILNQIKNFIDEFSS